MAHSRATFGSILGAIYRRRLTVLLVLVGALGAGFFYQKKVGPEFLGRAAVMVPSKPPTLSLSNESANVPTSPYLPDLSDELKMGAMGLISAGTVHDRMLALHPQLDERALRKNLRGNLDRFGNVEILAYAPDRERAASWANDFAQCFADELRSLAEESMRRSLELLREEEPRMLEQYRGQHAALVAYLGSVGAADLSEELRRLLEDRRGLEEQVLALDLARARGDSERPVLERTLAARPEFALNQVTYRRNPAFEAAIAETRDLSTQIALARLQFRDGHPEIQRLQTALDTVRQQAVAVLQEEMVLDARAEAPDALGEQLLQRLVELDITLSGLDAQRAEIERRRAALDERLAAIPSYLSEVALREAELANQRAVWEKVSQRRAELDFHLRNGVHFTLITDGMRARPESAKEVPALAALYVFCAIAGLSGGLLVALLAEMIARIRSTRPY